MYSINTTSQFMNDVSYYYRKKNYRHIKDDIKPIVDDLSKGIFVGDEIPNLNIEDGGHTYKVRCANTDAKVGKSNGYRIIYYVVKDDKTIFLLTIYSKKDTNNIPSDKQIIDMVRDNCL